MFDATLPPVIVYDLHTVRQPVRHYGGYATAAAAEAMRTHLIPIVALQSGDQLTVDPLDEEVWLARLMAVAAGFTTAPRSVSQLPEWWPLWVANAATGGTGHLCGRTGTAPCGELVHSTPVTAGRLATLHFGSLCTDCWPSARWPV